MLQFHTERKLSMASLASRGDDVNANGLIFLDSENLMVRQALEAHFGPDSRQEPVDIRAADFDDTNFHVFVSADKPEQALVSISIPCYAELYNCGADTVLGETYEGMFAQEPTEGFDLTLKLNEETMGGKDNYKACIDKVCALKTVICSSPFRTAFEALNSGTCGNLSPMQFHPRSTESTYLIPGDERVICVFVFDFPDPTDTAIARVFLQEFAEAQRNVRRAPPVTFSREITRELESIGVTDEDSKQNPLGFLSFTVLPNHVSDGRLEKTIKLLATFRNYLHYHIKASKSHLHSRMRSRVSALLKVLNDARPKHNVIKEKKTMKGKTFNRR